MARYKSKRRASGQKGKTVAGAMLGAVAVFGFMAIGYLGFVESQKPELDPVTLCSKSGPVGHLAILLDTTDPVSLTQLQAAQQEIEEKIDAMPVGTRISFSTVSPDSQTRKDAFYSICKPPSGEDANQFTQNPRLIQATYEKEFLEPVEASLTGLLSAPTADASPIMETLQEFITAIPEFTTTAQPRELILMSDLMQHSEVFSFYRGQDWDSFVSNGGLTRLSRNFNGAEITVLRFPRAPDRSAVVEDFWVRYFDAQGFNRVHPMTIGDL